MGQKIGLFQIQNPLPQGFDPILSPAFKIFQFFPQSGERAHERVFSLQIQLFWYIAVQIRGYQLFHALLVRFDFDRKILNLALRRSNFLAFRYLHLLQHPIGVAVAKRDCLKPCLYFVGKVGLAHIRLRAAAALFGTPIVAIFSAPTISSPLCGNHAAALATAKEADKRKIVLHLARARPLLARYDLLHGFK